VVEWAGSGAAQSRSARGGSVDRHQDRIHRRATVTSCRDRYLIDGGGDSISLEAPDGIRFTVRSRPFSAQEVAELDAAGPPARGPLARAAASRGSTAAQR